MVSQDTIALVGNIPRQRLLRQKKEVNVIESDNIVRLCVDVAHGGGGKDKSNTKKLVNVANNTIYEIFTHTELGGGKNAIKKVKVYVRIHPTRTPADYENVVFTLRTAGVEAPLGIFSLANGGTLEYETDNYFEGNLQIVVTNLPVSGEEVIYVDVIWRNLV